jgi:pimeloyl-ACP methyl ester carboxylesterase
MSSTRIEEFKVDVSGGQVYVKRWVPETDSRKAPIVLLHDSLGSVDLWRDFPAKLANSLSRCVVAYDRLGFGQSDKRDSLPSIDFIAEEASSYFPAIKDQLSLKSYVLFGHSVGGGMAVNIASQDPDCLAVVTVSAQAFVEDLTVNGIQQAKQMFEQPGQMERLEKWHGKKAAWVLSAWTDLWLSAEFENWSLKPALQRVQCPLLAIHGDNDEYGSSAFPESIAENSGGSASMLIIGGCGHMPHREKPEEVIGAAVEFLSDIG